MTMLLSRVASSLYWSARYLERAEDTARVLLQHTNLMVDLPPSAGARWDALLAVAGSIEEFEEAGLAYDERSIVSFLVDDPDNPGCLLLAVTAARDNLRSAREVVPRSVWQAVNDLYHFVSSRHEEGVNRAGRARFCDQLISESQRVVGALSGTISRDPVYDMLRLGRYIERADMTTRVLDVSASTLMRGSVDYSDVRWANVLRSLSALQMFRRATRGPVDGAAVVRFCLTNDRFPRSVAFCLAEVENCLGQIDPAHALGDVTSEARLDLDVARTDDLDGDALHRLADDLQRHIGTLHDRISATYFAAQPLPAAPRPPAELATSLVLSEYRAKSAPFDEAIEPDGGVRPAWSSVIAAVERLSPNELRSQALSADRLLLAAGATYSNQYGTTSEAWHLDPVPLVYGVEEWTLLERGLAQRARLFDALIADLYGPRRLVTDGLLPVELVHTSGGFQPAAAGWTTTGTRLTRYAADIARNHDGQFLVLRDHTNSPLGVGRALLNRSVLSRLLPDAFRQARVATITPWFTALRRSLAQLAPDGTINPRIVLMAPPVDDPDYAEQAYLATQLGYNLVDANDLTVRRARVYLRSIGGLEPVDVVLRTVADADTDPLEATPARRSGVAGLTQAAREGHVGLSNSFGSAVGSDLALAPFLGDICAALLGEALVLPSVTSRWCGDRGNAVDVSADLEDYVLHDASPFEPMESAFGWTLDDPTRQRWLDRLGSMPWRVVAQPRLHFATSPAVVDGSLIPATSILRAFVVNGPDGPSVLPGGLGRVVRTDVPVVVQRSLASKDVWVLAAAGAAMAARPLRDGHGPQLAQIDLRESLPSRSAEALYWLGRHAERAEVVARTALVAHGAFQRDPDLAAAAGGAWAATAVLVVGAVSGRTIVATSSTAETLDAAIAAALNDSPASLSNALRQLQRTAAGVREYLSTATWRVLAALDAARGAVTDGTALPDMLDTVLDTTVTALAAFAGLAQESVVRGPSWRFLDLGRRIERAQLLVAALLAGIDPERRSDVDDAVGELLLASCESLVAYRRRYRSDVRVDALLDLLVADDTNPRSLAFQIDRIIDDLLALPERTGCESSIELARVAAGRVLDAAAAGREPDVLNGALNDVGERLVELGNAVTLCWFAGFDPRRDAMPLGTGP